MVGLPHLFTRPQYSSVQAGILESGASGTYLGNDATDVLIMMAARSSVVS
jgi:hypothetical protein